MFGQIKNSSYICRPKKGTKRLKGLKRLKRLKRGEEKKGIEYRLKRGCESGGSGGEKKENVLKK